MEKYYAAIESFGKIYDTLVSTGYSQQHAKDVSNILDFYFEITEPLPEEDNEFLV